MYMLNRQKKCIGPESFDTVDGRSLNSDSFGAVDRWSLNTISFDTVDGKGRKRLVDYLITNWYVRAKARPLQFYRKISEMAPKLIFVPENAIFNIHISLVI